MLELSPRGEEKEPAPAQLVGSCSDGGPHQGDFPPRRMGVLMPTDRGGVWGSGCEVSPYQQPKCILET